MGCPLVKGCRSTLSPLFEVSSDPGRFTQTGVHKPGTIRDWLSLGGRPQNEGVLLPTCAVEFRDAGLKD